MQVICFFTNLVARLLYSVIGIYLGVVVRDGAMRNVRASNDWELHLRLYAEKTNKIAKFYSTYILVLKMICCLCRPCEMARIIELYAKNCH
jgi:hypothetical protein